jgi:hypothetical protein
MQEGVLFFCVLFGGDKIIDGIGSDKISDGIGDKGEIVELFWLSMSRDNYGR